MGKKCEICEIIKSKKGKVYEDDKVFAFLAQKPASTGHVILTSKEHQPILEQIPDFIVGELFTKANKISMAAFETIGAEGTNILMQNGVAAGQKHNHALLHIIPRRENDGLNLAWKPRQLEEEEMSTIELKIKKETEGIGAFEQEEEKPIEEKGPEKIETGPEEDYLLKQLERLP
ncbi:HIT domain-containing protein [Candidatus Woesearchaeota archaeon]|nr:HIT domain-containing protein [Candidatus Woesearchaeota archaeon]